MQLFQLAEQIAVRQASGDSWREFFRAPSLSMGIYVLPPAGVDTQTPHTEDEIYYVASGRGSIHVNGRGESIEPGSIVYVEANATHHFHSITEELTLLVFFAPAEYTNQVQ